MDKIKILNKVKDGYNIMEWTSLNDLRESYLRFFESKGHLRHKSFPLVPQNDKSVLLINAGMTPLKKYFTGELEPPRRRMTTCQKCIRTPDIEKVGLTARHGTFFEMLGNFSFGDYFKREAITWAWEYLTEWLKIPAEKLWVTIYTDDDEAFDIWHNEVGMPAEKIIRLGKPDNFWEHGAGPCGPCSEIYFDRGPKYGCGSPDCKPGCDCDRYMEFWNLVFTQFDSDGKGNYTRLAHPNIDTGMGLERLACIMQGVNNLFEVDTVRNIMFKVSEIAGKEYGANEKSDVSLRVITDHIRSTTFMVCDGVVPSNEGRGYVLRRLLRRAARHGRLLGINRPFLSEIIDVVARENYSEYPELTEKLDYIKRVVSTEEERFAATIDAGLGILSEMIDDAKGAGKSELSGEEVFKLYDTFGFPIDLTREIAAESGLSVDEEKFRELMTEQRERARSARVGIGGWSETSKSALHSLPKTEFLGYDSTECEAKVIAIVADGEFVERITEGEFSLVFDKTVFYGEAGGQVGDTGVIEGNGVLIKVTDTKKNDDVYVHVCRLENGEVAVGDVLRLSVDVERRNAIKRNHSAAHMLQAALRRVLGTHVEQAGQYVDDERVRFDFTHYSALTPEELDAVERLVNEEILAGDPVEITETDLETAQRMGAIALFGEKYGEVVRVVKMGDFSCELCGGTHLDNTAKAGLFKILSESSVAAGVRRIEGTTGLGVLKVLREHEETIAEAARELKANGPTDLPRRASQLVAELKESRREIEAAEARLAAAEVAKLYEKAESIGAVKVATYSAGNISSDTARTMMDEAKAAYPDLVIVIASTDGEKITFTVGCGAEAVKAGAHAGKIAGAVAAIAGGKGGGRPDSAASGGRDSSKLGEALAAVKDIVGGMIK